MTNLIECVQCGRRGLRDFVVHPDGEARGWVCAHTAACRRRQELIEHVPRHGRADVDGPAVSVDAVAGLAREVEQLRRSVAPVAELRNQLGEYERALQEIAAKLEEMGAKPRQQPAPSWLRLPATPDTAHAVLVDLVEWLAEVFLRYVDGAAALPECWLWHPDVVEELLWLSHAWQAAYQHTAPVQLAGDWHDRYRPGVVKRIKTLTGTCSLTRHQPRTDGQSAGAPVVPVSEAVDAIATWWTSHRCEAAPEPTADHLAAAERLPRRGGRR